MDVERQGLAAKLFRTGMRIGLFPALRIAQEDLNDVGVARSGLIQRIPAIDVSSHQEPIAHVVTGWR